MKQVHFLFLAVCVFITNFIQAQVIIGNNQTVTVLSNTAMPFPDGIVIESGGRLDIQSGGYAGIGVGKSIRVENGGVITSLNGTISVIQEGLPGNWEGIEFNGSSVAVPAIAMVGGAIRRAHVAIGMNLQGYRKLDFRGTVFQNNEYHIVAQSTSALLPNGSRFTNCSFLKASGMWPILMGYMNDLKFTGCTFNYQSSTSNRMVHLDGPKNVVIENCIFIYTKNAISLHYYIQDSEVTNCEFYFDEAFSTSANADAIQVGVEVNSESIGLLIANNRIYSNGKGVLGYGIRVFKCININLKVTGNQIGLSYSGSEPFGFTNGIFIEDADEGYCVISENIIEKCGYGIYSGKGNSQLFIFCNILSDNDTHLYVNGVLPEQFNGFDPNNQFTGATAYDIYNANHEPLIYYTLNYVAMNAHPPLINFNVDFIFVEEDVVIACDTQSPGGGHGNPPRPIGDEEGRGRFDGSLQNKEFPLNISVYPNPASEVVHGMIQLEEGQSASVAISSITGQVLYEQHISGGRQVTFDISTLSAGTYLFSVIPQKGGRIFKRFTVIR